MKPLTLMDEHKKAGAVFADELDCHPPSNYGNAAQESRACYANVTITDLSCWCKIRLHGADCKPFLHGLVSNPVKDLAAGKGNYSLHLTKHGKILSDLWVFHENESLFLLTFPLQRALLLNMLDTYLFTEEVTIEDRSGKDDLLFLQGKGIRDWIQAWGLEFSEEGIACAEGALVGIHFTVYRIQPCGREGYAFCLDANDTKAFWDQALTQGAVPVGMEALQVNRLEAGTPWTLSELNESVFPQEAGLTHAYSLTKGCYIGQETVARLQHRGHVNRELTGFLIEGDIIPALPLEMHRDGKKVGEITSVVYSPSLECIIGLGFLRCELREEGTRLTAKNQSERYTITVKALPFL
jgi:aminomethyltransferase